MNKKTKVNSQSKVKSNLGHKFLAVGAVLTLSLSLGACTNSEPTQKEQVKKTNEMVEKKEEKKEIGFKERKVSVDYSQKPEEVLSKYTEEGMNQFKLNYPDTYSMEFALKNIGKDLPAFKGKTMDGKTFDTKDYKGKDMVISVVKTTCPVCQKMTPIIGEKAKSNEDIKFVSLYPVDKKNDVKSYMKKHKEIKQSNTLVSDDNSWMKKYVVDQFNVAQVPTFIFVDKTGKISYTYIGQTDSVLFDEMLKKAFEDKKLYDYVRTETYKVDEQGNEIKEEAFIEDESSDVEEVAVAQKEKTAVDKKKLKDKPVEGKKQ